ncbi:sulfotransferase family protein [Elongatibacter sediminis]|uniref:Sulfotransferase n=1 Tax=Elongatibacter sediminis TaxID=3119006 RepID=A0AAW9R4Y5_9GAMM
MQGAKHTDPDRSPIFIVGCGRSGTTLLRQILSSHPRIHLTHEAFFYAYEQYTPKALSSRQWLERYFDTFSFRWLGLKADELREAVPEDLPRDQIHEVFRTIMKRCAARHGKVRYGEKSPLDSKNIERILKDFPDAKLLYIARDPRAIVVSFTRMPWGSNSLLLSGIGCAGQHEAVAPHLNRIHTLTLEELIADPESTLRGVLDHIGEPWDDAVLDHVANGPQDDVPPFPWFESATRRKLAAPSGREPLWRKTLSPAWIRLLERRNADYMAYFGYEPARLEREPSAWARAGALMGDLPAALRIIGRRIRTMPLMWNFRSSEKRRTDPQLALEAHLEVNPQAWEHYPEFSVPRVPDA